MQNNQSSLNEYLWFDFNEQYQTENYHNEETELSDSWNSNQNDFSNNLNNHNHSQSNINDSNSFLNITNDYDNLSEVDDSIHYLNFIRKSEIALSQQNIVTNQINSKVISKQEENIKTYKIISIDDSQAVINAIKMHLDETIFSVVGIHDPLKALMQVIRLKPDLILLDITMPKLNGYELCGLLKKHPSLKEVPIIIVTGKKGIINRVKAKLVKASDYITKPFNQKDLLKVLFKYLT